MSSMAKAISIAVLLGASVGFILAGLPNHQQLDVVNVPSLTSSPAIAAAAAVQPPAQADLIPAEAHPRQADEADAALEDQLEIIGSTVSTVATATLPIIAAALAVFTGLFVRNSMSNLKKSDIMPMDMAANEETPLNRRGVLAALGTLPMVAATPAFAAKTGGRVGGSAFRSRAGIGSGAGAAAGAGSAAGSSGAVGSGGAAVGSSGPTVIFAQPAPVYGSPYGFGAPAMPYGGYGFGFSTGELLALSAIELGEAFVREQRRQAFIQQQLETQRKLGQDEAQIQALQQQLAAQEQRMRELQQAMNQKGVPAPAQ